MRMRLSALSRALLFSGITLVAGASIGCGAPVLGPTTKIGQGESFACGNPKFDSFFEEVLDLRTKTSSLDGEGPVRKKLAEGLGLAAGVASDQALSNSKERADALKANGGSFYLQLFPEAKTYAKDGSKEKGAALAKAVEDTAKLAVETSDEYAGLAAQIRQTEGKLEDLKREAETAFTDPAKRAEVTRELDASQEELEKARMRAQAESGRALNFVAALARAVDTGGADLIAAADGPPGKKPPPGKPTGKPAGGAGKPAGGAGPAKPAGGGAKPKHKEDFDP